MGNTNTATLIVQKGGTEKTTLAINLAAAAETLGLRTALVDLDPQASLAVGATAFVPGGTYGLVLAVP